MTIQTQEQKDLIIGSLLGDGNLQSENRGKTWRYRALHKDEHKDYLFHKYGILKPLCGPDTGPSYSEVLDSRTGKTAKRMYFNTLTKSSLKFYGDMFYKFNDKKQKWVKDVPDNIEKFLTPRAVAYWYMDDGALKWLGHSNGMRICTESFSLNGVKRLQNALKKNFNITTTLAKKTKVDPITGNSIIVGYRITIPEASSQAFRELIEPYLVDCMKYKVSDGNKGHL